MAKLKAKSKDDEDKKIKCPSCGKEKLKSREFYQSDNIKYHAYGNRCYICKACLKNKCFSEKGLFDKDSFKSVLRDDLDKPFYEKLFQQALQDDKDTLGKYLSLLNISNKGKKLLWKDGETEEKELQTKNKNINIIETDIQSEFQVTREMQMFWGRGFENEDYDFLENELFNWQKTHKCDNQSEITLLKEICIKILKIRKTREQDGDDSKLQKDLQDLMKTASVDPAKANVASAGKSAEAYGVWIKDIEQKRPAEWYEEQEKYKDMDGFIPYIQKYIIRPIKNFFTGSKDFIIDGENYDMSDCDTVAEEGNNQDA